MAVPEAADESFPGSSPRLLFKSGFEPDTVILPNTFQRMRNVEHLAGIDQTTGYDWRWSLARLGLIDDAFFEYVISSPNDPRTFVSTELRTLPGPRGTPTTVLYLGMKGDDPDHSATTRNEYDLHPTAAWRQGYGRYWMMMQPDLLDIMPPTNWLMLMEWKEERNPRFTTGGTNNWRTNVTIRRENGGPPAWYFERQQVQPERITEQRIVQVGAPIPLGRWFEVEAFWRWGSEGRIWFAVDGETIFDQYGRFEHAYDVCPLTFWAIFKNYRGPEWFDADLSNGDESWFVYDDVEIWSDFPADHPLRAETILYRADFDDRADTDWGQLPRNGGSREKPPEPRAGAGRRTWHHSDFHQGLLPPAAPPRGRVRRPARLRGSVRV
ncbi:MAG: hypothetical protein HC841_04815, partial [Verrucomicrobiae bacterium]|nr:hypothetical protein [Verrucomicrobiae bacterium]